MKALLLLFLINPARSNPACSNCSTQPSSCPPNFITLSPGASSVDDCVCPPGFFEANSMCLTCPGGFVCPGTPTTLPIPCASGTFCPPQSIESIPCPAGFVCGMTVSSPTACDPGFYCPESSKQQLPCPSGTLCNGSAVECIFGGMAPNCVQCVNCTCGVGFVAYNNTCLNLTNGCPLNLDCTRRDAFGSAPCVAGYALSVGVCVANVDPFVLSPPVIALIAVGGVGVIASAIAVTAWATASSTAVVSATVTPSLVIPSIGANSEASFNFQMPRIKLQ
jgi:hypothetical protein